MAETWLKLSMIHRIAERILVFDFACYHCHCCYDNYFPLPGPVSVFVRVRPMLRKEEELGEQVDFSFFTKTASFVIVSFIVVTDHHHPRHCHCSWAFQWLFQNNIWKSPISKFTTTNLTIITANPTRWWKGWRQSRGRMESQSRRNRPRSEASLGWSGLRRTTRRSTWTCFTRASRAGPQPEYSL